MLLYPVDVHKECINYSPRVEFDSSPGARIFKRAYIRKSLEIFLLLIIRNRATNFSSVSEFLMFKTNCSSIAMFGMYGFYVLARGAIQGHLGTLFVNV